MCKDLTLIETTGYIRKEEKLHTVKSNIIQNSLVLESPNPFPGYHGKNLPEQSEPGSLFFIVNNKYSFEELARITTRVKKYFKHDFNACQGFVKFKSSTYSCIRIKYLKSFALIPELQNLYIDEKVKFLHIRDIDDNALIEINKNFYVSNEQEYLYQDLKNEYKCYVELPTQSEWKNFTTIISDIKNNLDNNNFDAAQGVLYRNEGIVDVIRIFDKEKSAERMLKIREMYLERVNKSVLLEQ